MSVKEDAIITVSYQEGQLVLSDNEGNPFDPKNPEAFSTSVRPNGKIGWTSGKGVDSISIQIDSGADIFKKIPSEKKGVWGATIDDKQSGSSKYTIHYTPEGAATSIACDPTIKIEPPIPLGS